MVANIYATFGLRKFICNYFFSKSKNGGKLLLTNYHGYLMIVTAIITGSGVVTKFKTTMFEMNSYSFSQKILLSFLFN